MNSSCVEDSIRKNIPWSKVSEDVKQVGAKSRKFVRGVCHMPKLIENVFVFQQIGNSSKEYDKAVVAFSIKNQLRFKGNLVRQVRNSAMTVSRQGLSNRTSLQSS